MEKERKALFTITLNILKFVKFTTLSVATLKLSFLSWADDSLVHCSRTCYFINLNLLMLLIAHSSSLNWRKLRYQNWYFNLLRHSWINYYKQQCRTKKKLFRTKLVELYENCRTKFLFFYKIKELHKNFALTENSLKWYVDKILKK